MLEYLAAQAIPYTRIEHPPVFTCAEAESVDVPLPGLETKNLFLRDDKHRFYLVLTTCAKRLDLKGLGRLIGAQKLQFGAADQLFDMLGLTPGAVTVLALVNDPDRQIRLLVDGEYWPAEHYLCHPLVNTATLVLDHAALLRFLVLTGHEPQVIAMPGTIQSGS